MNTFTSQESQFSFSPTGFTDYVITECPGRTQKELYKRTLDWIAITYHTPSEVIKGTIEDEYIRIEGIAKQVIGSESKYQVEISFKEGKYKFDVIEIEFWHEWEYPVPRWKKFEIDNFEKYLNRQGQLKNTSAKVWQRVTDHFNNLNNRLQAFLMNDQIPSKKTDW